jgi:NAD(P)H dehydrogenase (quinone)
MARILVYAASGHQGMAIVEELLAEGHQVRAVSRGPASETLRRHGAEVLSADMGDLLQLQRASEDIETVVLLVPLTFDQQQMVQYGKLAVDAAASTGVRFLVYQSSICYGDTPVGYDFLDAGIARIAEYVLNGKLPALVLRPPLYLDNLLAPWTTQGIRTHRIIRYPLHAERALPWITYCNQARFVARAVNRSDLAGKTYDMADAQPYSGNDVAAAVSAVLQKYIRYESISPEQYGEMVSAHWEDGAGKHVAMLYGHLMDQPEAYFVRDYGEAERTLLPKLETLEAWARRVFAD